MEAGETHEGTLADVLIGPGGALLALDADRDGERRRVPVAPSVSIAGRRLAPAA